VSPATNVAADGLTWTALTNQLVHVLESLMFTFKHLCYYPVQIKVGLDTYPGI
jgi:hypothetical protein